MKSTFPPSTSIDFVKTFAKSPRLVASAKIISDLVFLASSSIVPNRTADGVLLNVNVAPSACAFSATFHAMDLSSSAPNIIPFFPFNKLNDITMYYLD